MKRVGRNRRLAAGEATAVVLGAAGVAMRRGCGGRRERSVERQMDPLVWGGEQKLVAGDAAELDEFGWSVSLTTDHALVGRVRGERVSRRGLRLRENGDAWTEEQKLVASDGAELDKFGYAVSIAGDRALVGAYGGERLSRRGLRLRQERQLLDRGAEARRERRGRVRQLRLVRLARRRSRAGRGERERYRAGRGLRLRQKRQRLDRGAEARRAATASRTTTSAAPSRSPATARSWGHPGVTAIGVPPTSSCEAAAALGRGAEAGRE